MYSAGDSSGDGLSGLNQFAGMGGSIDWAAMAQQWIQMHDTGNFSSMPDAPPPPNISNTYNDPNVVNNSSMAANITPAIKKSYDEKGEADMDMDEDEENSGRGDTPPPPAPSMQLRKNREQTIMQSQAPWYMQQQSPLLGPPANENLVGIGNTPAQGAPQWSSTVWPPRINLPPPVTPPMLGVPLNGPMQNPTAHIPSLLKMNVPNPNTVRMLAPNIDEPNTTATVVDAKKRKMLPAWIREGLEKMEREKQKQLEREQNKKREESESSDSTIYTSVGTTVDASHTVNMKYKQPAEHERSGFEGEEEAEDLDGVAISDDTLVLPNAINANDDDGSATSGNEYEADHENNSDSYKGKRSYEDVLSELMIGVRTTLTELLLEVTNQEIAILAHEAVNAHKAKASSAQVIRKSALSSITGKLGLAAYDDSTGDESSNSDDDANADNDPNNDSEEEIKASIRTKRRTFAKITDEIEERIAASAAREEQKLKYYTSLEKQKQEDELCKKNVGSASGRSDEDKGGMRPSTSTNTVSKSYDGDFGETTETKLQHSNGKRQKDRHTRKERTTRFSDNKDTKNAAAVAATYISKIQSVNVNPNGSTLFPISTTNTSSSLVTTTLTSPSSSSTINATPFESSHVAYNMIGTKLVDDSSGVSALNKNLLSAAEAAYEKVTKSHRSSSSRSSLSRSEKRERDHRSSRYDHRDYESDRHRGRQSERERERERKRKRKRERESERDKKLDRVRRHEKHQRKHKDEHTSDEDDDADEKCESKTSSSDTASTTSSSTSSSSTSHHSSHYSRTSTASKRRREHDYDRRNRHDDRGSQHSRRSEPSRSHSRSRQRSYHHHQRSSSHRHSSAEDDNDSRSRYSSSRHDSSRKRSRSRSRSTYSSSSHWRRR